jgi:hypothetical protein
MKRIPADRAVEMEKLKRAIQMSKIEKMKACGTLKHQGKEPRRGVMFVETCSTK